MFNSFKNWVKKDDSSGGKSPPITSPKTIKPELQKKFANGVHYNMKIVIRGSRSSGKTTLFNRLQGDSFQQEYNPTPEIQTSSIHWNYKATDDIVKVDVWDVVDKGYKKKENVGLKISNEDSNEDVEPKLDASFVNVYKGAHAVIFIFDMTNRNSYSYVEEQLSKTPSHIPCLILANNKDSSENRKVYREELTYLIEGVNRPPGTPAILILETSMKTGYGLKYIHKFFNLPFLLLQRESLMMQLQTNHLDVESCLEELRMEGSENYEHQIISPPQTNKRKDDKDVQISEKQKEDVEAEKPEAQNEVQPPSKFGFMSRFFKGKQQEANEEKETEENSTQVKTATADEVQNTDKIDDFVPDNIDDFVPDSSVGLDNSFFDDPPSTNNLKTENFQDITSSSSSDEEDQFGGNPMVVDYNDEVSSFDGNEDSSSDSSDGGEYDVTNNKVMTSQISNDITKTSLVAAENNPMGEEKDLAEDEKGETVVEDEVAMETEKMVASETEEVVMEAKHVDEVTIPTRPVESSSSDSDEDGCHGNPMVTGYSEVVSDVEVYQDSSEDEANISEGININQEKASENIKITENETMHNLDVNVENTQEETVDNNEITEQIVDNIENSPVKDLQSIDEIETNNFQSEIKFSASDLNFLDKAGNVEEQNSGTEQAEEMKTKKKKSKKSSKAAKDSQGEGKTKKKKKKKRVENNDGVSVKTKKKKEKIKKVDEDSFGGGNELEDFLASD